jgi:2'-5' RNA ligase
LTSDPHSAPAPSLPDLERELDRFRSIRLLRNHWARPAGRPSFYWYLTFDHSPGLRSLARKCQEAIAFPYYDLTDPSSLHMTLDRIAFQDTIQAAQLHDIEAAAMRACQSIPPFEITFSLVTGTPGAIGFTATPAQSLQVLRDALRTATLSAYPGAPVKEHAFHPHVAIAYANAPVSAADVVAAVEDLNVTAPRIGVTISEAQLVLLEQRQHAYTWNAISRIPLTGHRA